MQNKKSKLIVINAIIAALYVVVTSLTAFMAFGDVQFRIAEMLNHLFAFDKNTESVWLPVYYLSTQYLCQRLV